MNTAVASSPRPAALDDAKRVAAEIAQSSDFQAFVGIIRERFPWRFKNLSADVLDRDYLRIVDHHLRRLVPQLQPYMERGVRRVFDFGCGSGGSAIALAMAHPEIVCRGCDVDAAEIQVARERARLYGVADRCDFQHVPENQQLPFEDAAFDMCLCSSVLEYVVDKGARRFCVQEMVRLVRPGGLLFISVPNRLYPFEVHSWWRGKPNWGWNYFPKLLKANTVDCTVWEVQRLARPDSLKLYRTPLGQLFRPWSNFCLQRSARQS